MVQQLRRFAPPLALAVLVSGAALVAQAPQPAGATAFAATDVIPLDASVRTATLPNGIKFYIRHNDEPASEPTEHLPITLLANEFPQTAHDRPRSEAVKGS